MIKSFFITTLLFSLILGSGNAQIITTVAGNGLSGYGGDGGPATNAPIHGGVVLTVLSNGDVLFGTGFRIRKLSTSGTISLFVGNNDTTGSTCYYAADGFPATSICPGASRGITCDSRGNVYFTDWGFNAIRKVDIRGIVTTIAGSISGSRGHSGDGGPATAALLDRPEAIAVDKYNTIYFGEQGFLRKIDSNGIISTIAGVGGFFTTCDTDGIAATACQIGVCLGIAADTLGNIYYSDQECNKVRKIDGNGIVTTVAGNGIASYWGTEAPLQQLQLMYPMGFM